MSISQKYELSNSVVLDSHNISIVSEGQKKLTLPVKMFAGLFFSFTTSESQKLSVTGSSSGMSNIRIYNA